jgi:hypothetical protein
MHDPVYRNAVAWQNTAYNQPPHLGFWLGAGIDKAPKPNILLTSSLQTRSGSRLAAKGPFVQWIAGSRGMRPEGMNPGARFEVRNLSGQFLANGHARIDHLVLDRDIPPAVHMLVPAGPRMAE